MPKTDIKVSTKDCNLCHEEHSGYRVKLDSRQVQYVICGIMQKRISIVIFDPEKSKNPYGKYKWTKDVVEKSGSTDVL